MSGKPRKLTEGQLARAQALAHAGYRLKDVAARFGVTPSQLNRYGVRARPTPAEEKEAPGRQRLGHDGNRPEPAPRPPSAPCAPFLQHPPQRST